MPRTTDNPAAVPASSALESGEGDSVIPSTGIGAVVLPFSARCTARGRRTVVESTRWSSCLAMSRGIGRAGSASTAASRVVPRPLDRDRVSRTLRSSAGSSAISSGPTRSCSSRDQPVGKAGMTSGGIRTLPYASPRSLSWRVVSGCRSSTSSSSPPRRAMSSISASSSAEQSIRARAIEVRSRSLVASAAILGGSGLSTSGRLRRTVASSSSSREASHVRKCGRWED